MASPRLDKKKMRVKAPSLFDTFGYGVRPQRPTTFATLMVSLAVFFHFGLLVILWQEAKAVPSIAWTGTSTALLCLAALAARHGSISVRNATVSTLFFFVAYPMFAWLSYKVWGQYSSEREALLLQTVPIMALGLALYLVGAAARSHRTYRALWMAWTVIACYVLLNINKLDPQSMYQASLADAGVSLNYQQLGDAFAICSVILAPRIRQPLLQWLFIGVAVCIMFIIPSRSAAFFGAVSLGMTLIIFGNRFTRVSLITLGVLAVLGYQSGTFAELFEGSRFESALTPDTEDGSWSMRQEIMDYGMTLLIGKPFTGEWAFQLSDLKFSGYYIHNALDVWAQTGLIPFLIFLSIWVFLLDALMTGLVRWPRIAKESVPVLLFAALSWALSRNITFVALFFCLGFASAALTQARYGQPGRRRRRSHGQFPADPGFAHTEFANTQFGNTQFQPPEHFGGDHRVPPPSPYEPPSFR